MWHQTIKSKNMELQKKIGCVILNLRQNMHSQSGVRITQQDIADEADITLRYYQLLEAGKKMPTLSVAEKIAKAFNLKLSEFCVLVEEYE